MGGSRRSRNGGLRRSRERYGSTKSTLLVAVTSHREVVGLGGLDGFERRSEADVEGAAPIGESLQLFE
jgi:hypothetical protein